MNAFQARNSRLSIGILGSGRGSNAGALLEASRSGALKARVVCLISDVEGAGILDLGPPYGVPAYYISGAPYKTRLDGAAQEQVLERLREHGADTVVLAGFMRIVKPGLLQAFPGRVVNVHPALLPAFPGLAAWRQALEHGVKLAGCTVHLVDEGMDTGPILAQRAVPVLDDDTPESLHARIQEQERLALPEALNLLATGRARIEGRRVLFS